MRRDTQTPLLIAQLDLAGCRVGPVLEPLRAPDPATAPHFAGWDAPLSTWGGFDVRSGFQVVEDNGRCVLELGLEGTLPIRQERSLVTLPDLARDYALEADVRLFDSEAPSHNDRLDCHEAYVGLVFRMHDSRHFYLFAIEGRRRTVLYRRADDEWHVLAEQPVTPPEGYVTLRVDLDGDGMRCRCSDLGVTLQVTDTSFPCGRAGIRGIGHSRVAAARVFQTLGQTARQQRVLRQAHQKEEALGAEIPDPILVRTIALDALGTVPRRAPTYSPTGEPFFADFAVSDRYDMLVAGETLRALTVEGELLWELPMAVDRLDVWPDQRLAVYSKEHTEQGRWIYAMTGERARNVSRRSDGLQGEWVINDEMVIIAGTTGDVVARAKLPELDDALRYADYSRTSANLTGGGRDIILREWRRDAGGGGTKVWAYDDCLNLLWERRVRVGYGHHDGLAVYDVDGDGRDEVLAGGTLFDADGQVVWEHDRSDEVARITGAGHYDSVAVGHYAEDPAIDPVAFLLAGSAGVYVVDALSGRTRMAHRVGHAQFRTIGRFRDDLPGRQVLIANRWGNMGILTLFSGRGDRQWSIQPDYIGEGSFPVRWGDRDTDLVWANTSGPVQAFYDGYGRRVKRLPELSRVWGQRMRNEVQRSVVRMGTDPRQLLTLTVDGVLYAYGPA